MKNIECAHCGKGAADPDAVRSVPLPLKEENKYGEAECGQRTHSFEGRMERLIISAFAGQKEIDHNTSGKEKNNHPSGQDESDTHDHAVPTMHAASFPSHVAGPKGTNVPPRLCPAV